MRLPSQQPKWEPNTKQIARVMILQGTEVEGCGQGIHISWRNVAHGQCLQLLWEEKWTRCIVGRPTSMDNTELQLQREKETTRRGPLRSAMSSECT